MRPNSIAIIGVGRLGSNLAQELIRSGAFSKIYLDNRSESRLESVTLSLRVFASCVGSQIEIIPVREKFPQDADIALITIKENYDPRTLLEKENLPEGFERNVRTIGKGRKILWDHALRGVPPSPEAMVDRSASRGKPRKRLRLTWQAS
jgi:glutamyl-tRNA reductase